MTKKIPTDTIAAFARSIAKEGSRYGFQQVDFVRLVNALLDGVSDSGAEAAGGPTEAAVSKLGGMHVETFPLRSERLEIRPADPERDVDLLAQWLDDEYGRHFVLSSSSAQPADPHSLLSNPANRVGIVLLESRAVGAVAFLDIDELQQRAELRKLIGDPSARGQGIAEEATRLWIYFGGRMLGIQKFYVSTLQTHLRNIQLNEAIGFRIEGMLQSEVAIDGARYDVLRMGLLFSEFAERLGEPGAETSD